jgi:hypothetical protein
MRVRRAALAALMIAGSSPVVTAVAYEGTPKEQAACRPDVSRYCSSIKPGSDSFVFLSCLQANRAKLSKACLRVLVSHGV